MASSDPISHLHKDGVVPEVVSPSSLSYSLKLEWPTVTLDTPGATLDREATQSQPKIFISPVPEETSPSYTLIMTDPDLTRKNDKTMGQVRHWLVTNVSITKSGELQFDSGNEISPYVGPAPMPILTGPHRYVFILCKTPSGSTITSSDYVSKHQELSAEFPGIHQDLKDRMGFDAAKLIDDKGLQIVAVNYMLVAGNVYSVVENMKLGGASVLHKVTGE